MNESLLKLLSNYTSLDGLFVEPNIPPKKLFNAKKSCGLAEEEHILALIDCSVFGSAKQCLLIGSKGIYYHNDWNATRPGTGEIPYSEFASSILVSSGLSEISLGPNKYLDVSGSRLSKKNILEILTYVQRIQIGNVPKVDTVINETADSVVEINSTPISRPEPQNIPVSILLGIGIFIMPYIFTWFTFRKGYSNVARTISVIWLIIIVFRFILVIYNI
jgi:hypothetical protein